jgi:hypothetical protein
MLGVAGIMDVYRAGGITIANAPGTGIADDKAIYSFMPEIVEFYTGEKPILKNVPTWRCAEADSLAYVLDNLADLVVKEVHGSGGYGMLIGPTSSKAEIAAFEKNCAPSPTITSPSPRSRSPPCRSSPRRAGAAPCRSAALRAGVAQWHQHHAGRPDARGAEEGIAGGQFQPGRGHQGQLGAGGMMGVSLMLGRSAWGLFWMFRYLERAENTARLLDAGFRMALTRGLSAASDEWRSVLITLGLDIDFAAAGGITPGRW